MTAPILTLAEVQALAGFTEGPWAHDPGVSDDEERHRNRAPSIDTADGDPIALVFRRDETTNGALLAAAPALHATCLHLHAEVARLTDALRQIATAIGTPAHVDSLADLPGLVMMVQAVVQRAESSAIVVADAVAAERMAIGAWLRTSVRSAPFARSIEHGDHIDDDAPPLPSLRMTLLLRDELNRQIKALEAGRDRRIDPVEHARAVMATFASHPDNASSRWFASDVRKRLLARVGPDVLAEVER